MTLEREATAELFGIAGTFPRPGWVVLDAARDHRYTGELVFDVEPTTRVYLDRGRIYLAERATDPSLGARLVDAGALNAAQLEHGAMRLGDREHLGRLFERVPSVDRHAVLLTNEMMNDECLAWLARQQVRNVEATPYLHHLSGVHRWDDTDDDDPAHGDVLPAPAPTDAPVEFSPPSEAPVEILAPEALLESLAEDDDMLVHWDEPSWLDERPAGSRRSTDADVAERPVAETPVIETPVLETPVIETPVIETPAPVSFAPPVGRPQEPTPAPEAVAPQPLEAPPGPAPDAAAAEPFEAFADPAPDATAPHPFEAPAGPTSDAFAAEPVEAPAAPDGVAAEPVEEAAAETPQTLPRDVPETTRPPLSNLLLSSDWADRLETDGLPDFGSNPLVAPVPLPTVPTEPTDRFELVWPSGEIDDNFGAVEAAELEYDPDHDRIGPTARVTRSGGRPADLSEPPQPEGVWDFETSAPSFGPDDPQPTLERAIATSASDTMVEDDVVLSMRRAVASIETGSIVARRRLAEHSDTDEPSPEADPALPGRVAARTETAWRAASGTNVTPTQSVFDDTPTSAVSDDPASVAQADPVGLAAVVELSVDQNGVAEATSDEDEPARVSALRRLIGGIRRN